MCLFNAIVRFEYQGHRVKANSQNSYTSHYSASICSYFIETSVKSQGHLKVNDQDTLSRSND